MSKGNDDMAWIMAGGLLFYLLYQNSQGAKSAAAQLNANALNANTTVANTNILATAANTLAQDGSNLAADFGS